MDPLSITAGVVGVLSSLTTLSIRINDFRNDVQDAELEIRQLIHEVNDLTLILKQVEDAQVRGKLPGNLTNDLVTVLQRLNTAVIETELHLKRAAGKKLQGAYWAFSGKSQCNQLCRRLESYKSTLNLTLTMSDVICGHEVHEKADEILNGINNIRQRLSPTADDYILQRYLVELETVYDGSTVAGTTEMYKDGDDGDNPETTPVADYKAASPSSTMMEQQISAPIENRRNFKIRPPRPQQSLPTAGPQTKPQPPERAPTVLKPPTFEQPGTESLAEIWSRETKALRYTQIIPKLDRGSWSVSPTAFAARGEHFAYCIHYSERYSEHYSELSYGVIYRGTVGQAEAIRSFELDSHSYDPSPMNITRRKLVSLAFLENGRLLAVLRCLNDKHVRQYFITAWRMDSEESFEMISPVLDSPTGAEAVLSRNCLFFAYQNEKGNIVVRDIYKSCAEVTIIHKKARSECAQIVWSKNSKQLLFCHGTTIEIFNIPDGSSVYRSTKFCIDVPIDLERLVIFFSETNDHIVIVQGSNVSKRSLPSLARRGERSFFARLSLVGSGKTSTFTQPSMNNHFIALFNLKTHSMSFKCKPKDGIEMYEMPEFSPDGSCFVTSKHTPSSSFIYSHQIVDVLSGKVLTTFELKDVDYTIADLHKFDFDGRRIFILHSSGLARDRDKGLELYVWE